MHPLDVFFSPRSVAIIGASGTPGKAGHQVMANIKANGYAGTVYPVNPRGGDILGWPVVTSIAELPKDVDLAVIVLPADTTPKALRACADQGVKSAVLAAGGFAEIGEAGLALQDELERVIAGTGIRVLGPNSSGHISTPVGLTSGFFPLGKMPRGRISYIAQTGDFATHTMRRIMAEEPFGIARVIGLGNTADVEESEALDYLGDDPETDVIMMYLESLKNPHRFLEVARRVARKKPLVMLWGGACEAGEHGAVAHTAALATDGRIVKGALRQAGIIQIGRYGQLILAAKAFAMVRPPCGNHVGFVAPSGALLARMTDLGSRHGLVIPLVPDQARARLQEISPPHLGMGDPVDIRGSALQHGSEYAYRHATDALLKDGRIDAVVVVLVEGFGGVPDLEFLPELAARHPDKPVLVSFTGEIGHFQAAKAWLEPRGIPCFQFMEEPVEMLDILWQYQRVRERYSPYCVFCDCELGQARNMPAQERALEPAGN